MAQLTIQGDKYLVDGQELTPGLAIRRYDSAAPGWFTGEVGQISIYNFDRKQYVPLLALVVEGYAPSPLVEGDEIEIVSEGE